VYWPAAASSASGASDFFMKFSFGNWGQSGLTKM
jgi:hypothetical protein